MKTFWVVIISAGLGIVLGVGTSWARLGRHDEPEPLGVEPVARDQASGLKPAEGPPPQVVVDSDEHDFGPVAFRQSVEHAFQFSNQGAGPLRLESGGTSCSKCTVSQLPAEPIQPGATGEVVVVFNAVTDESDFRKTATILTNDPISPRIELTVTGKVVVPAKITPSKVVFSRLAATEARTTKLEVVAYLDPDFKIKSFELTEPDTAPFFDVAIQPLATTDVESTGARRGYEIALTVKPGMPLGPLRQNLLLHTNLPELPEMRVPIEGSIDSDISIIGGGYDHDSGIFNLGPIERRGGAERKLLVLIRGERRHDVHVSVAGCEPAAIQAALGEPSDLNSGAVVKIPLIVKIPAGSPPSNHLLHYGKILLETDHPEAKQIRIWVQFAVEE